MALQPVSAKAPNAKDMQGKWRSIKWLQHAHNRHTLRVPIETVTCAGPNGTTVSYRTSTRDARSLVGAVTVRIANKKAVVPGPLLTGYLNEDDKIVMKGYAPVSGRPAFALRMELIPTVVPKPNEVATYAGTVTMGSNESEITCSATQAGAGLLKPQVRTGNISVVCMRAGELPNSTALPLVTFETAANPSGRLVSDVNEVRSATDSETLPAFLVSQFTWSKSGLLVEMDDGSAAGNMIVTLDGRGQRVPTNQPVADPAIYGVWTGTYQRFDAGRQLKAEVDCYAF